MGKRIVIALGGNALGNNLPEQMAAVKHTAQCHRGPDSRRAIRWWWPTATAPRWA